MYLLFSKGARARGLGGKDISRTFDIGELKGLIMFGQIKTLWEDHLVNCSYDDSISSLLHYYGVTMYGKYRGVLFQGPRGRVEWSRRYYVKYTSC